MECLKCGRETDQTFCTQCREVMQRYPVKPDTAIQLPKREESVRRPVRKKAPLTPEMRIEQLKGTIHSLWRMIFALLLVITLLATACCWLYRQRKVPVLGQNYSTVTQPTADTAPELTPDGGS